MNIAEEVDCQHQGEPFVILRCRGISENGHLLLNCRDYVAGLIAGSGCVGLVGIDIAVMPCLGIGIFIRVAGVVGPVGVVDD